MTKFLENHIRQNIWADYLKTRQKNLARATILGTCTEMDTFRNDFVILFSYV